MNESPQHSLHARFLRGLAVSPQRPAVRIGAETVSYEEVHELALRWAGALLAGLPAPPSAVGVLAGKSPEAYAGLLAALYVGAAAVPLHPDFPAARTRRMLEAAGVSAVIADRAGLAALTGVAAAGPALGIPVLAPSQPGNGRFPQIRLDRRHALTEPRPGAACDVAYMLFTSGSTGRPKGVPITHGNASHYFGLLDRRYDFAEDDVFSQTFDLNFDCGMFDLFCAWGAGASANPVPAQAYVDLPAFFAERKMTVWFSTPSIITLIRRMGGLVPGAIPTLRWSLFAGEALQAHDAADWQAAAPGSTVENLYGPTELTITVSGYRWSPRESPCRCVNGLVPIGTVHEGHDHVLLDADGTACDEGELCITGPQMTAGYLDPADNAGRFIYRDGQRWYRTGDRVRRLGDGALIYLGRLDSQVQVQGWRVELAEIEHAMRACPAVEDAIAVARSDRNGTELVVYYTGTPAAPAELARHLRLILPAGMLPRHYRHVAEFPLNSNRKIDRSRLTMWAAELPAR